MKYIVLIIICNMYVVLANTWQVGPNRNYKVPSSVSNIVANGDTVLIDSSDYRGDVCAWSAHNLLLKGVNGKPKLYADGKSSGSKAIWVIKGNNTVVNNVEFLECKVPDKNGAGIRQEGVNLTVQHCVFRRNEMGILAGNNLTSTIIVEYSELERSGYGDGFSHNVYINHIYQFIFRYNYSHHAYIGHEVKSRAHRNYILYNRLSNEDGKASREIDVPNGGYTVIIGNIIHQGINAENSNMLGYGMEGLQDSLRNELYVVNNTFVNQRPAGTFIQYQTGTSFVKSYNNIFTGIGTIIAGSGAIVDSSANFSTSSIASVKFVDAENLDYHLQVTSPVRGLYKDAGITSEGNPLTMQYQYVHPNSSRSVNVATEQPTAGAFTITKPTTDVSSDFTEGKCTVVYNHNELSIILADEKQFTITIYDVLGRRQIQKLVSGNTNVDVSHLPIGLFFVLTDNHNQLLIFNR